MPSRRSCQGLSGKEFIESPCHRRRTHLWRFHIIFIVFIVAHVALLHFFGVEGVAFACRGVCGLVESGWKVHQSNSRATTSYHVTLSLRHTLGGAWNEFAPLGCLCSVFKNLSVCPLLSLHSITYSGYPTTERQPNVLRLMILLPMSVFSDIVPYCKLPSTGVLRVGSNPTVVWSWLHLWAHPTTV